MIFILTSKQTFVHPEQLSAQQIESSEHSKDNNTQNCCNNSYAKSYGYAYWSWYLSMKATSQIELAQPAQPQVRK